tara:strand:- start:3185 stop:4033 length:849 start_codon:yes stop_codon:yes gene_type:complete
MISKIILGTANFGKKYGISKKAISNLNIRKICKYSFKKGIKFLDTASDYKGNYKIIKKLNKNYVITTKVLPDTKWRDIKFCEKQIRLIQKKINYKKIDTLFFHDEKFLYNKKRCKVVFENLVQLKKKKFFKNLGVSIYNFNKIKFLINNYELDVIQCPFSIFDQRLIKTGAFENMKKKGIKIHVRSIFLQGILLNKISIKEKIFNKLKANIRALNDYAHFKEVSTLDLCLNYVMSYKIDKIVIGFSSLNNLKEIVSYKKVKNLDYNKFSNISSKFLDPRKWS